MPSPCRSGRRRPSSRWRRWRPRRRGERLRGVARAFVFRGEDGADLRVLQQHGERSGARLAGVRQFRIRAGHLRSRHARVGTFGVANEEHDARSAEATPATRPRRPPKLYDGGRPRRHSLRLTSVVAAGSVPGWRPRSRKTRTNQTNHVNHHRLSDAAECGAPMGITAQSRPARRRPPARSLLIGAAAAWRQPESPAR